jgi:non-ribosomal peptide synthetase component F
MRWFDLALIVWSKERGLGARLRYNAELFEAASIARLVARFRSLLDEIVAAPERRLSELAREAVLGS